MCGGNLFWMILLLEALRFLICTLKTIVFGTINHAEDNCHFLRWSSAI